MVRNYTFTCNKDPIDMNIGDSISITANDRRHAYRLLAKKMGLKAKLTRYKFVSNENPNQMLMFEGEKK